MHLFYDFFPSLKNKSIECYDQNTYRILINFSLDVTKPELHLERRWNEACVFIVFLLAVQVRHHAGRLQPRDPGPAGYPVHLGPDCCRSCPCVCLFQPTGNSKGTNRHKKPQGFNVRANALKKYLSRIKPVYLATVAGRGTASVFTMKVRQQLVSTE